MEFSIIALVPDAIPSGVFRLLVRPTDFGKFIVYRGKEEDISPATAASSPAAEAAPHADGETLDHSPLVQAAIAAPRQAEGATETIPSPRLSQLPLFARPRAKSKGPKKVGTKLTLLQVRALKRALREGGRDDAQLGEMFGIHRTHVSRIRRGTTYGRIRPLPLTQEARP